VPCACHLPTFMEHSRPGSPSLHRSKANLCRLFLGGGFLWARCPSWRSNYGVKAVEAIKQTQVVTWRDLSRYPVVGRTRLSLVSLDQVYYKRIHTSRTKHTHTFNFRYIIIQKYTHKNTCVHTHNTQILEFCSTSLIFPWSLQFKPGSRQITN